MLLVAVITTGKAQARTLSVDQFRYLKSQSIDILDTFFHVQQVHEERLPIVYFEADAYFGPTLEVPTTDGVRQASIAMGQMTLGSVPWTWSESAGLRLGLDGLLTNLATKRTASNSLGPNDYQWGYNYGLLYVSGFDRAAGWAATVGLLLSQQPRVDQVGDQLVFSTAQPENPNAADRAAGVVHATLPFAGLTLGLLIDAKGARQIQGTATVAKFEFLDSIGPELASFPQLKNHQFGIHATRFRAWSIPLTLSADAAARYETEEALAFDHATLSTELSLFVDDPDRTLSFRDEAFSADFHLRAALFGSYYNAPRGDPEWGGRAEIVVASVRLGSGEGSAALGVSRNYYGDLLLLPLTDALLVNVKLSMGW